MENLWEIANSFRFWVCSELRNLHPQERIPLRGDYLFIIDSTPRFIVMVDGVGAWSVAILNEHPLAWEVEPGCPLLVSSESVQNCIVCSARTIITTDSVTLQKLLLGTLKAKIAFLTSKVLLAGDLAAFLKMVSILKRNGVRPRLLADESLSLA